MRPTAFVLTIVASVLLVLLVAACGGGGGDNSCGENGDGFGGPYPKEGNEISQPKKDAFGTYQARGFTFSQATVLENVEHLQQSVSKNLSSPYGVTGQLYNYVISLDCTIVVAEWIDEVSDDDELALTTGKCPGGQNFIPGISEGTMVNFFPEDLGGQLRAVNDDARRSPCWLGPLSGDRPSERLDRVNGLLDALSKHFMLAQVQIENATINDFDGSTWPNAKIAYAGEIVVNPSSCTFSLNNNSGTYKPGASHLPDVVEFFLAKLGHNTLTLSDIGTWC
jgi:hypothetical protein